LEAFFGPRAQGQKAAKNKVLLQTIRKWSLLHRRQVEALAEDDFARQPDVHLQVEVPRRRITEGSMTDICLNIVRVPALDERVASVPRCGVPALVVQVGEVVADSAQNSPDILARLAFLQLCKAAKQDDAGGQVQGDCQATRVTPMIINVFLRRVMRCLVGSLFT
jgi:hypothetical protein